MLIQGNFCPVGKCTKVSMSFLILKDRKTKNNILLKHIYINLYLPD
jgi:hypothetical protein